MTKQLRFSSVTDWHRDSRYWNFERPDLVSVWLALGRKTPENGCVKLLPGSHHWLVSPNQLDFNQFFRTDIPENQKLLKQAVSVKLRTGDVLLFHSNLFHAAGCNQTSQTKFSMVLIIRSYRIHVRIVLKRSLFEIQINSIVSAVIFNQTS